MRFRYFFIAVLVVTCCLQLSRTVDKNRYVPIKHTFEFKKAPAKNTTLKFENPQRYLVFYSPFSPTSKNILENLERSFQFTKAEYDVIKITDEPDISKYNYFVFATDNFTGFKRETFKGIRNKIFTEGGTVFFLNYCEFNPFNNIAGIKKINGVKEEESGINFLEGIFPGIDSFSPSKDMLSGAVMEVILEEGVEILAETDNEIPLIWESEYGEGRVIYNNSNFLEPNITRGVMNQLIAFGSEWYINPILNSKLIHLDDFPSPIPRYENETIRKAYGMDTGEFYNKIWWQDMISLAERRNLVYSGFIIIDYNNTVKAQDMRDIIPKITLNDLDTRARELLVHKGELGIHGYNHNPLVFEGDTDFEELHYVPWESDSDILFGLNIVNSIVDNLLGRNVKLYSYVPPSNILKNRGKVNLVKAFPHLKTISSLFYGDESKGAFVTEIGRDDEIPEIYTMPRFSSGFAYNEDDLWGMFNAIGIYGYMSHFVHPDDIISDDRGFGKDWEQIFKEFEKMILEIENRFPYFEPTRNSELTQKYMNIEDMKIHSEREGDILKIGIENFREPFDALVRIREADIKKISAGKYELVNSYENNKIYFVRFTSENTLIELVDRSGDNR